MRTFYHVLWRDAGRPSRDKKVEVAFVCNLHFVTGYLLATRWLAMGYSLIAILTIYLITPRFVA